MVEGKLIKFSKASVTEALPYHCWLKMKKEEKQGCYGCVTENRYNQQVIF